MPRKIANYERYSSFRRPDWRNHRVLRMTDNIQKPKRCIAGDDQYIKDLRSFRIRHARRPDAADRAQLAAEMPEIDEAVRIFDGRNDRVLGRRAFGIECRLLAEQSDEEIAHEVGTNARVVEYYEALFFNIRDRMKAHDWILTEILVPAFDHSMQAGPNNAFVQDGPAIALPYFDATLRSLAYFGGPLVLDFAMSGFRRDARAKRREQTGMWFDESWINRLRQRSSAAAHSFQVNKFNVMELFATHAKLIEIIRNQDDEHKKQSEVVQAVTVMISNMSWAIGPPKDIVEGQLVAKKEQKVFEAPAVEFRDEELALVQGGSRLEYLEELKTMQMPAPRVRTEEPPSVDAK